MGTSYMVTIAGRRLEVSGDDGMAAVRSAFGGIVDPGGNPAQATLEIETEPDPAGRDPWRECGIGSHRSREGALAVIRRGPSSVETFLPGLVPRLHLAASPDAMASGDLRAQPANHAIASWLASSKVQLVHGAAVAWRGRGVLLVGIGGRGKSTTALACAQAGFSFLGDDLCVVESGCADRGLPARVHGIYATAKLNHDSRNRLGARDWPLLGITPKGKDAFAIPPEIRFERTVPLVALVAVRADGVSPGIARCVPPRTAIGLLAATALPVATGSGTPGLWLRAAASIAREVPAYEMGLDWDLERVAVAVRSIIESCGDRTHTTEPTSTPPNQR